MIAHGARERVPSFVARVPSDIPLAGFATLRGG